MWPTLTTTPHSLSLSLSPSVGTTEAESLQNFKEWLDMFALMFCASLSLVKDLYGNRIYGLFDHMKKGGHDNFEAHLSGLRLWATQCQNALVLGSILRYHPAAVDKYSSHIRCWALYNNEAGPQWIFSLLVL